MPDSPEVQYCADCLESDRHLAPLFPLCSVVLQNADSQSFITTHSCTTSGAHPGMAGVKFACQGGLLSFVVRCSARCLAFFLSRGLVLCLWCAGGAPVHCAAVCCVSSASALGSGRGGAARGLEERGPVLQPQVGGLGAGFVVENRA